MLVGRPNVGKSALMNHSIGQKIAITSDKPQTTRNRIQIAYADDRGQTTFPDTPGIYKAKNKLGQYMVSMAEHIPKEVDVILWLVEPATFIGAGECHVAGQPKNVKTLIVLVINKIDTVRNQDEILAFIAAYKDVCDLVEIALFSALKDKNTDLLTGLIFKYLPYGLQFYDEDTVTDQLMRQIAAELIHEKALRLLDDKTPYDITVTIEKTKECKSSLIDIETSIACEREPHRGIIIGRGGSMLKRIDTEVRKEIESMMDIQMSLQLWVKVRKEWRDNELYMKNHGYNQKEI